MPDGDDSDEALAARAGGGDRAAFELIMRRHKTTIFHFVRRYVGQNDDAYDILQETFLAAWSASPRYDPSRRFLPWLRTIALNKCRDFARRQTVRRLLLQSRAKEPQEPSTGPDIEDAHAVEALRLQKLDRAIARLRPFYKEPLLLTAISGLSHQEAAAILNTTPKAIEMRTRRARIQLAEALSDKKGEG